LDLLSDLNEPQRQAVTYGEGPLLVLAGAGSGKTRVITRRVAYLISQGVAPWHVLAITFTNKAAGEMQQRIEALGTPRGATLGTFHAVCARLLREFSAEAALGTNYSIYDRDDQLRITREAIGRLNLKGAVEPGPIHSAISRAKNALKTAEAHAASAGSFFEKQAAAVHAEYDKLLAANNALDFDDLLLRTAVLLRDRPDIRQALGRRYRHVLIDEYQDTNHAQYLIAHGIALEHQNLCATGDPDQSIYAWRGADIGNILEFEQDYPEAAVIRLEENYRSTKAILTVASSLIACNTQRKAKALWTRREQGPDVRVVYCDDEHAEAVAAAERIRAWRAGGRAYNDVAVFYRVNSLSRVLEQTLFNAGVPYRVTRGVEFFNRREVKDVLAYLKLLVNPDDDLSCLRIINEPSRGIGATTQKRLQAFAAANGVSVLAACRSATAAESLGRSAGKVRAFGERIDALAADTGRPVREIVEQVFRRSGMEEAFEAEQEEARQARANIDELITTAAEFDEATDGGTLSDYLHQVSLVSDLDHFDGAGGAVTLMTLHAAKGLEFPAVLIVGCEDGLLPFSRADFRRGGRPASGPDAREQAELEEERRLAFVGMTRAKDELTLSCARRRMLRGRRVSQSASRFLGEIGRECVLGEDRTTPDPSGLGRMLRGRPGGARGGFYEDVAEREVIEAMAEETPPPPEYQYLAPGCRVHHAMYGEGTVLKVTRPWPETRAEIAFDDLGLKTIVLNRTNLELL